MSNTEILNCLVAEIEPLKDGNYSDRYEPPPTLKGEGTQPYKFDRHKLAKCFREKPFSTRHIDGVDD
jgi:hypothetical protein